MKSYLFKVVIEPDEDRWFAYCSALEEKGAATWGDTREEALKNLQEVVEMVVRSLLRHGEPLPEERAEEVQVFSEPRVVVTI